MLACEDESSENCPTPTSGAFTKVQLRGTITKDSINSLRADFGIEDKYEAIYDVSVVAVEYETLGPKGEEIMWDYGDSASFIHDEHQSMTKGVKTFSDVVDKINKIGSECDQNGDNAVKRNKPWYTDEKVFRRTELPATAG